MLQRSLAVLSALAVVTALAGCDHHPSTSPGVGPIASIVLTPSALTLSIGDTLRLGVVAYDKSSNLIVADTVVWSISDSSVATVSDSGTVKALIAGTATITAKIDSISATAALTVSLPATKPMTGVAAVVAGFAHSCAILTGGNAVCWGSNADGQLGNDSTTGISPFPLPVSGGWSFVSLAAGYAHTCGLTSSGTAYCWGDNAEGELGNVTATATSATPVQVAGDLHFAMLSAGYSHTCGVTTSGAAYCWGSNESGELGNSTVGENTTTPVLVAGGLTFASVSAGGVFTCGVTTAGAAYCWGSNGYGVLGNGGTSDSDVPVAVAGGFQFASISAGVYHTCALTSNGAAYCWGNSANGQLGTGITSIGSATPLAVVGGNTFASLTTGELSTCATTSAGAVFCWGSGSFGSLGNGSTAGSTTPQPVGGAAFLTSVSAGISFHACSLANDGTAYCWGYDDSGELGDGTAGGYRVTPQQVSVPNTE
jgi:alpha-tubulin suppressor-like RCC1 family protein